MIFKILTGNEHGGTAVSSDEILTYFLKKNNFKVIFLCNERFASQFDSNKVIKLRSFLPPIITSEKYFKAAFNRLKFVIWILWTLFLLLVKIKSYNIKIIHTTNNHSLLICLLAKIFFPNIYLIAHWRCVGLGSSSNYKYLLNKIDAVISISTVVKKSLPENLQKKSQVIYNGVDIKEISSNKNKYEGKLKGFLKLNDNFLIGTIGSYTKIKSHNLIIDAVYNLKNKKILINAVLIGSTPNKESEKYLRKLKEKVRKLNIQNQIYFVDDKNIFPPKKYIVDLDLFVGTTWNDGKGEGFGLIYIEAMANGLPVIAINVGAASEIITNNKTGFLINNNCAQELSDCILRAISYENLNEIGNKAEEHVHENFDISRTLKQLEDFYGKIS